MKKLFSFLFAVLLSVPAFAGDSNMGYSLKVNNNGEIKGARAWIEEFTTNDTLVMTTPTNYNVTSESGKTCVITAGGGVTLTLPAKINGAKFEFVAGGAYAFNVDPNAADTILYGTSPFAAGEKISSTAAATGDRIEMIGVTGGWLVTDTVGTIANGG